LVVGVAREGGRHTFAGAHPGERTHTHRYVRGEGVHITFTGAHSGEGAYSRTGTCAADSIRRLPGP